MPRSKGAGTRGQEVSGGGLIARLAAWTKMSSMGGTQTSKKDGKYTYHKPGSQNPRKGGPGKRTGSR